MKVLIGIILFLYSMSVAADVKYDDGSYYNDDYIHEEDLVNTPAPEPADTYVPAPGDFPKPVAEPRPAPMKKKIKKRKPQSAFKEVHAGGRVGSFVEVGGSENSANGRGSK